MKNAAASLCVCAIILFIIFDVGVGAKISNLDVRTDASVELDDRKSDSGDSESLRKKIKQLENENQRLSYELETLRQRELPKPIFNHKFVTRSVEDCLNDHRDNRVQCTLHGAVELSGDNIRHFTMVGPNWGHSSDGVLAKTYPIYPKSQFFPNQDILIHVNWTSEGPIKCDTYVPGLTLFLDNFYSYNHGHFFNDMLEPVWFAISDNLSQYPNNNTMLTFHSNAKPRQVFRAFSDNQIHPLNKTFGPGTRCYEKVAFATQTGLQEALLTRVYKPGAPDYIKYNQMIETVIDKLDARVQIADVPDIFMTIIERAFHRRVVNQRQLAALLAENGIPHEVVIFGWKSTMMTRYSDIYERIVQYQKVADQIRQVQKSTIVFGVFGAQMYNAAFMQNSELLAPGVSNRFHSIYIFPFRDMWKTENCQFDFCPEVDFVTNSIRSRSVNFEYWRNPEVFNGIFPAWRPKTLDQLRTDDEYSNWNVYHDQDTWIPVEEMEKLVVNAIKSHSLSVQEEFLNEDRTRLKRQVLNIYETGCNTRVSQELEVIYKGASWNIRLDFQAYIQTLKITCPHCVPIYFNSAALHPYFAETFGKNSIPVNIYREDPVNEMISELESLAEDFVVYLDWRVSADRQVLRHPKFARSCFLREVFVNCDFNDFVDHDGIQDWVSCIIDIENLRAANISAHRWHE